MTRRSSRWLLAAITFLLVMLGSQQIIAAEIGCDDTYQAEPIPDDIARKLWPSGFRPAAGMCQRGFIRGAISRGDYEKVQALY
jgi:hypothetical protein